VSVRTVAAHPVVVHERLDPFASGTLVLLCLCWGLNQVAIKVTNAGLQPVFQSGLRSLLGALLVVLWCRLRRVPLTIPDGTLIPGVIAGLIFAFEFILIYVALDFTTVARGIVLIYFAPVVVAVGAHFLIPRERLTAIRVAGLVAAFAGVVVAFSDRLSLPNPQALFGDALCLIAAFAWAATTLVIKTSRLNRAPAEKVLLYQLAVSAPVMLVLAPFFGPLVRGLDWLVGVGLLYQVVIVVAASYVAWFSLLARYPAAQLSAFTFLTPLFAVALGAFLLSEPVSPRLVLALLLVAGGIFLVNRPRPA
jgi:drug/metabolite transporter (DMT)-like permease